MPSAAPPSDPTDAPPAVTPTSDPVAVRDAASAAGEGQLFAPDGGGDEAQCGACDEPFSICMGGLCRPLSWINAEATYSTPAPAAPIGSRHYGLVAPGQIYGQRIQVVHGGSLLRLGILASTAQTPTSIRFGLYDELGGYAHQPVVTLGPLVTDMRADDGRQEFTLETAVRLAAGSYWIALIADETFVFQTSFNEIPTVHANVSPSADPWLDPFPQAQSVPTPSLALSLYAVLAPDPL